MGNSKKRRTFTGECKHDAVTLAHQIGCKQAAQDLGVNKGSVRNWAKVIKKRGTEAFAPLSERTDLASENRRLRAALRIAEMERDILQKAATYFAKESE